MTDKFEQFRRENERSAQKRMAGMFDQGIAFTIKSIRNMMRFSKSHHEPVLTERDLIAFEKTLLPPQS